jgi:hypothetical protein
MTNLIRLDEKVFNFPIEDKEYFNDAELNQLLTEINRSREEFDKQCLNRPLSPSNVFGVLAEIDQNHMAELLFDEQEIME